MNLKLIEYGSAVDTNNLNLKDLSYISKKWKNELELNNEPFSIIVENGNHKIRAQGITGFINIDNVDIEIKPKFLTQNSSNKWRKLLWNILLAIDDYSKNIFDKAGVDSSLESDTFLDIMGWVFLNSLESSSIEGYPRGYQDNEGFFYEIKGSIDYSKISTIISKPLYFPCKYDTYSEDIPINRLLKWGALFLSKNVKSNMLATRLIDISYSIKTESSIPPGILEAENIFLPPQFQYIEDALSIAKKLLKQESLHYKSSSIKSFGFLWKSYDIYEKFIGRLLDIAINSSNQNLKLEIQSKIEVAKPYKKTRQVINQFPDFKIKRDNETLFILDAKYKNNSYLKNNTHGLPTSSDINQVIIACQIERAKHGILIYPSNDTYGTYHQTWKVNYSDSLYISTLYVNLEKMSHSQGEYILAKEIMNELEAISINNE